MASRRSPAKLLVFLLGTLIFATSGHAAGRAGRPTAESSAPPADFRDLDAWLDYKQRLSISALPDEAEIFYRRGVEAWRSGRDTEALRLVRGAAALDPNFAAPHLALIGRLWARQPSQALLSCASLLDMLKQDFRLQLEVAANGVFFLLHALFFGVLAASLLVVALRQGELRHLWKERLGTRLSPGAAGAWAWTLLLLPWFLGVGLALPATVMLAMLWPTLRGRERFLFVVLAGLVVAAPLGGRVMGRLALPLREDHGPCYGVLSLQDEPYTVERQSQLTRLGAEHPNNPFLQYGLAWTARKGEDLTTAEAAYRRTLELWPKDDRARNNLGNLLAIQGRFDEALKEFQTAVTENPANAAAYFNASQVHTRLFDYAAASDALARASALNFDMVQHYQSDSGEDGALPLVDQWIAPSSFWHALLVVENANVPPAAPPAWRDLIETSGWPFSAAAALLVVGAFALGLWWDRKMPIRGCSNCGRVVCRRCSKRRREVALCPGCAQVANRAESPEFAGVLLAQRAKHIERIRVVARTGLAALIPGFGLLAFRRVFGAIALLGTTAVLASRWLGIRGPFLFEPRIGLAPVREGHAGLLAWLIVVYAVSFLAYLARWAHSRHASSAPVRSRPAPSATFPTAKAA